MDNVTTGSRLLEGQMNQSGDDQYLITEGFQARVMGAPLAFASFQVAANAAGPIDPPEPAAPSWNGFPTPGGGDPTDAQQVGAGKWFFHTGGTGRASLAGGAMADRMSRTTGWSMTGWSRSRATSWRENQ